MSACSLVRDLALAAAIAAQDPIPEPAAAARDHFAAGRYQAALDATASIEDAVLRAQWRFHVLYVAGDLPGALRAALEGLASSPRDVALAINATQCAVELGDHERAARLAERLEAIAAEEGDAGEHAARIGELRATAAALARTAELAAVARRRARWTAMGLLVAAAAALIGLALHRSPTARST